MDGLFVIAGIMAAGLVAAAYRFSTRTAAQVSLASLCFWIAGIALLRLNAATFPDDETRREMGEGLAVLPLLIALPLTAAAVALVLAGLFRRKAD